MGARRTSPCNNFLKGHKIYGLLLFKKYLESTLKIRLEEKH